MEDLAQVTVIRLRRWFVITPHLLLTFKEQQRYKEPTETIPLGSIEHLLDADQETHR